MACGTILNSVSRSKQLMSASWWVFAVAKRLLLERHGSLLMFELRVCAVKILEELQWVFPGPGTLLGGFVSRPSSLMAWIAS